MAAAAAPKHFLPHFIFTLTRPHTYYMPFSATYYARLLHFGWNESNQMSFSCFQVVSFVVSFYRCWLLRRSSLLRQLQIIIIIVITATTITTLAAAATAAAVSIITIIIYLFICFVFQSFAHVSPSLLPSPNRLNIERRNVNKSFRCMRACRGLHLCVHYGFIVCTMFLYAYIHK